MSYNRDENFMGFNPINWYGVVEDRDDPLKLGRVKVRIIGWHNQDRSKVTTENLPWAHPMYPLNNSNTFSSPKLGDWVVGFFLDGENAQQPVMMGMLPGIKQKV